MLAGPLDGDERVVGAHDVAGAQGDRGPGEAPGELVAGRVEREELVEPLPGILRTDRESRHLRAVIDVGRRIRVHWTNSDRL